MDIITDILPLDQTKKDTIFSEAHSNSNDFKFDQKVASVFDDMVSRSVPYYHEMQRMTAELASEFAVDNTNLYDIGCATGTTLIMLDKVLQQNVKLIGVDNSQEMLDKARTKMIENGVTHAFDLDIADLHQTLSIENASVVTLLLTLQFVRPLYREKVMQAIYNGLNTNGCLILIEKVTSEDSMFNRLFIKNYYDFKRRNGYSDTEIAHKREALENVLIPYRMEENFDLLKAAGFQKIDVFFRWYNFCGIIAMK